MFLRSHLGKVPRVHDQREMDRAQSRYIQGSAETSGSVGGVKQIHIEVGDRSLPFFKKIRQTSKKPFERDEECTKAFSELQVYLGSPKLLTRHEGGVELNEFDIQYLPRGGMKAQTLANFVLECTARVPEVVSGPRDVATSKIPPWKLYADGTSNEKGAGAGILIKGPNGEVFEPVLKEVEDWRSPIARYLGIDLVGQFLKPPVKYKDAIVAVDYFSKWVEIAPLRSTTSEAIKEFIWKKIITRYGIPKILVSDNRLRFDSKVEVMNRTIFTGIKNNLLESSTQWYKELDRILWSYRTTSSNSTGETCFSLVYGTEAVLPIEELSEKEIDHTWHEVYLKKYYV
ncbi:hypothetical protein LIER_02869 [Lithospermum erythrorhizon]|uniref:Integrase catalytic domain-containing protein n=1 Tax=Lithospermum erythrorhizon TaxID=34254 RepID=A0AAV3NRH4_LITER